MNFRASFSFMVGQRDWLRKVLIGGLLLFVPIVGWLFVAGYVVGLIRGVARGSEELPEWEDWGDLLTQGLFIFVALLVYSIPGAILGRMDGPGTLLSILWGVVVGLVFPAAMIRFAIKQDVGAFFDFNQIFSFIKENVGDYITIVILTILACALSGFGLLLLGVGVVFTIFWAALVGGHLCGTTAAHAGLPSRL